MSISQNIDVAEVKNAEDRQLGILSNLNRRVVGVAGLQPDTAAPSAEAFQGDFAIDTGDENLATGLPYASVAQDNIAIVDPVLDRIAGHSHGEGGSRVPHQQHRQVDAFFFAKSRSESPSH